LKKREARSRRRRARDAVFQPEFREDLRYWVETDRRTALRLFDLIEAVMRDPFGGLGKPEPLKGDLSGYWSRRINDEHRLGHLGCPGSPLEPHTLLL
jgi:toxin YoeB